MSTLSKFTDGFYLIDAGGRIKEVHASSLGIDIGASIGKHILSDVFFQNGADVIGSAINHTLKEQVQTEAEELDESRQRWYLVRSYPTTDGGVAIFVQDTTEEKQTLEALQQSNERLASEIEARERLHEASMRLWRSPDLKSGIAEMLEAAIHLLGADMGHVQLLTPAESVLEVASQRGFKADVLDFFSRVSIEENSACARSLRERRRIIIHDVETEVGFEPYRQVAAAAGYRAVQASPLFSREGKPLGILSTHFRHPHHPSGAELERLDLLVRQGADFIELKRSEENLRDFLANDTTLLRQAEQAARVSQERFDIVRDGAQVGFWFCDLPFDKLIWDNRVKDHFWLMPDAMVTIDTFYERIHPDDRERTRDAIAASITNRTRYNVEYRTMSPTDGREKWIRAIGRTFYDADGKAFRFDGVTLDITENKRAEAALRENEAVLRSVTTEARAGLVMVDNDRRYLFANQTYADLLGLPDANIVGRRVSDVLPAVYEKQIRPRLDRAFAGERVTYELHVPEHTDAKEERFYDVIYEPRMGARGRYVVVVIMDITARKKTQQILEHTVAERTSKLRETVAELEGFSYSITHDLRAPLRALNSFSQVLLEDYNEKLDEPGKQMLGRIQQSVMRMDRLIQDVLQYSRILRTDLKLEPVDADRLVRGIVESYPDFLEPEATVQIEGQLPKVLANEAALTQCFSNLLNNAVKFVHKGTKPSVIVRFSGATSKVRFWIEDNGIGIDPKYLKNIFGMFQRLSNDYEGTGVGLSIVSKAVERMGGLLGAESEPGKGSRFWFELNLANDERKAK